MTGVQTCALPILKTVVRDGGSIEASGRNKDDRVIAAALAAAAYAEQVQPKMMAMKLTKEVSRQYDKSTPEEIAVGKNVSNYLKRIGVYGSPTNSNQS